MAKSEINNKRLIVIGGSSGSLEVILEILPRLPTSFPVPMLFVMHRNNSADSLLRDLLARKSALIVKEVEEKEEIVRGTIYLAPADFHVLIERDGSFSLDYSEKINYSRPSIDVTFISAAEIFGPRLTGILLSGANDDGSRGMEVIKEKGGTTIVQDPADAGVDMMPKEAIRRSEIDHILTTAEIGDYLFAFAEH